MLTLTCVLISAAACGLNGLSIGQAHMSYPKTMSSWDTDEQKPEAGAETRGHDDPDAAQVFEAGLGHQDRDDKKDDNQEWRGADANEEEEVKEVKQDVVDEEAEAKENEPAKEHTKAENQDEDHEEVVYEHQQQQTQKEQDREKNEEDAVADAKESDAELVKGVTENADARVHRHEEPESAEQPVPKRDRSLK